MKKNDQKVQYIDQDTGLRPIGVAPKETNFWRELLDWVKYILVAVLIGFLLTNYVIQRNEVVGSSMYPTLIDKDQLWVEKLTPVFGEVRRGDIITFHVQSSDLGSNTEDDLVKRVIGVPGDHIVLRDEAIYINDELLQEPYLTEGTPTYASANPEYNDLVLEDGMYFVLGDNRTNSRDSRSFGPIAKEHIIGEVWIRIYPFSRFGKP